MKYKLILCCLFLPLILNFSGCSKKEIVPKPYRPTHAHDAYLHGLKQAGLADTALGKDWLRASETSLRDASAISLPFKEAFYVDPSEAAGMGYGFDVKRGQKIEVIVEFRGRKPGRIFVDLFRVRGESVSQWIRVASADEKENRLAFEPRRDARYVVRLQPELLRGGQYTVTIRSTASLLFPVYGKDRRSVGSGFGAPRDGGRRTHYGVDIFAARHTPVLAPSRSRVYYVGRTPIGGNVIWLYDSVRDIYLYFAHLQKQDVYKGQLVKAGQILGSVGNTGNARTTPPHLHFSISKPGESWIDPHHWIVHSNRKPRVISADLNVLGKWVRSKAKGVSLKSISGDPLESNGALDRHSPLKVLAAVGKMYRVVSPDGVTGYIPSRSVEVVDEAVEHRTASHERAIKAVPTSDSATVKRVDKGERFLVLGKFREYWMVKTQTGNTGWIQIPNV